MASVNAWVQEAGIEAQQVRAATLQKLALKASQKRVTKRFAEVAAQPGVEQITAIKAAALGNGDIPRQPTLALGCVAIGKPGACGISRTRN
jgi:hypothetical protein